MCGVIGIIGDRPVSELLYYGLLNIQHRGQSSAGKLTYDGNIHVLKDVGLVRDIINNDEKVITPGNIGIGHTRYSTAGSDERKELKRNAQPEYLVNPFLAAVHNGNIINGPNLCKKTSRSPRTECDIQWLLLPMADQLFKKQLSVDLIFESCEKVMKQVKGSYSVLYLADSGDEPFLFAMTDPHKIRPLVLGKKGDNMYCFASETRVFKKIGFDYVKDIPGGSVVIIDKDFNIYEKQIIKATEHPCMFEYVYFAKPDSRINTRSIHKTRDDIGKLLAQEHPVEADIVVPVPESGRRYALGYSRESGIPIDEGIMKDKSERSFIQQTQDKRDAVVSQGLSFLRSVLSGKRVILLDDSIVRGTNIRKIVKGLKNAGAKEIHLRIGCPPLIAPCYLGIDMKSNKEFIARNADGSIRTPEQICKEIGADSLGYISEQGLMKAIRNKEICRGCINFPDGYPSEMRKDVECFYNMDTDNARAYEQAL